MHPRILLPEVSLYFPLIAGCALRLLLWGLSGNITTVADENDYLRLGQLLAEGERYRGQWPPGYPAIISMTFQMFGESGPYYLRIFQMLTFLIAGLFVIQMSHFLYGKKGALISGYAWAFYLPLAFHAHRFWPETLFLNLFMPGLYLLFTLSQRDRSMIRLFSLLATAGVLFGLSLYLKESPTYLFIPLSIWLFFTVRKKGLVMIFPISIILTMMPLMFRNYTVFKGFVPVGSSMLTNIRAGLNAEYVNHDYNRIPKIIRMAHQKNDGSWDLIYRHFIDYGSGWTQSTSRRYLIALKADSRSAWNYALAHKKEFVGTRIKKLADFVTPLSFFVRDLLPNLYSGTITSPVLRRVLIVVSLLSVICLFTISGIGLIRLRHSKTQFSFFVIVFVYFGLTALLSSFSRIRIPIEPLLFVLLGSLGSGVTNSLKGWTDRTLYSVGVFILILLWALNFSEILVVVNKSW
jgi:hypothetical protein